MSPAEKKAVAAEFERLLRDRGLDFRRVKAGVPHRTTFARAVAADLTDCLLLHWHSYREQFCFEVGWHFRATFDDMSSCLDLADALRRDAAILPINVLMGLPAERWWDWRAAEDGGRLEEAFTEVQWFGLPFLDRVARAKRPSEE